MKRISSIVVLLAIAGFIAGCGPSVVVENRTSFPVRVILRASGHSEVLSPSPGESSTTEVFEGAYRVSVIPDTEWIEYARLTRKVLNEQLANSDTLTGPQLLEVIRRLKEIATRMQQFEQAAGSSSGCAGSVSSDSTALVVISAGADGKLIATCR